MCIDTQVVRNEDDVWGMDEDNGSSRYEDLWFGEGRVRRPVLQGNSINFRNIDGPRSFMVAWKKLVNTSMTFRREARQHLQRRVTFGGPRG